MYNIYSITTKEENSHVSDNSNRFQNCKEIVDDLVEAGVPNNITPSYIYQVAKEYGISGDEAQTCIELALANTQNTSSASNNSNETLYAQSGYFYPSAQSQKAPKNQHKDGMDNLNNFGQYQRMMFGF